LVNDAQTDLLSEADPVFNMGIHPIISSTPWNFLVMENSQTFLLEIPGTGVVLPQPPVTGVAFVTAPAWRTHRQT